jgi:hypothetical protein
MNIFRPRSARSSTASATAEAHPLDVFASEHPSARTDVRHAVPPDLRQVSRIDTHPAARRRWVVWALAVLAVAQTPLVVLWIRQANAAPTTGTLHLETDPTGAEVAIDRRAIGRTPINMDLAIGTHAVEVRLGPIARQLTVAIAGRTVTRQRLEVIGSTIETGGRVSSPVGHLLVTTEPTRIPVMIDGVERGVSPLTITDLSVGDHEVSIRTRSGTRHRTVRVEAGATSSLLLSVPEATAASGWVTIDSPLSMRIFENGALVGTTDVPRIMMPTGEHELELVNEVAGYRVRRTLQVVADKTTDIRLEVPRGTLAINAQPWADVSVDGQQVGQTPIGALSLPLGSHEVVFRHPQFGERRETVLVTLKQPARIGVDLRPK